MAFQRISTWPAAGTTSAERSWTNGLVVSTSIVQCGASPRRGAFAAEAVAVGDDDADAVEAVAGQVDVGGAAFVGVFAEAVPGLAVVGRHVDFDLADAAGSDLVDAIFDRRRAWC